MDDEQKTVPFYKRSSFRTAMIIWMILTVVFILIDHNFERYDLIIVQAVSLFVMVMCAYLKEIKPKESFDYVNATIFCFLAAGTNTLGFFVSGSSHILFFGGMLQAVMYIIMGASVAISKKAAHKDDTPKDEPSDT